MIKKSVLFLALLLILSGCGKESDTEGEIFSEEQITESLSTTEHITEEDSEVEFTTEKITEKDDYERQEEIDKVEQTTDSGYANKGYLNIYGMSYSEAATFQYSLDPSFYPDPWSLFIEDSSSSIYYPLYTCRFNKIDEYIKSVEGYSGIPIYVNEYEYIQKIEKGDRIVCFDSSNGFILGKLTDDICYTSNYSLHYNDNGDALVFNDFMLFWNHDAYYYGATGYRREVDKEKLVVTKIDGNTIDSGYGFAAAEVYGSNRNYEDTKTQYIFLNNTGAVMNFSCYKDYQEQLDYVPMDCMIRFYMETFDMQVQTAPEGYTYFDTSSLEPGVYLLYVINRGGHESVMDERNKVIFEVVE